VPGIAVFGAFRLRSTERVLEKDGVPLKIGSRALDILVTLLQSAPEVVDKRDLMSRVWGSLVVDEGSLRFHIASLRKILGDTESGAPYITNIPGRGYCLAASVSWIAIPARAREDTVVAAPVAPVLPGAPLQMVGRDAELRDLTRRLRQERFVSIVGPGGIGKTTIALAVAHEVLSEFDGAVRFLDLSAIQDAKLLGSAVAVQLGLTTVSEDALAIVLSYLRERRLLLVLDNCEHLIQAAAILAESLFREASQVHILCTSREALRAEGEWVHHLSPLECPPEGMAGLTATQALAFPAVQLFIKQASASGYPLLLKDEDAPVVAEICRRLDGIALALELAASRVGVYGVQRTASLLDSQFRLLWKGRRTALPRHQTLAAALDWSYNLLSEPEQTTLRRLAIFYGPFSLDDAVAVVGESLDPVEVTEALGMLVEKSLVTLAPAATVRYRLLDTTKAYAGKRLADSGERLRLAERHCTYIAQALERFNTMPPAACIPELVSFFADHLSNVRAAHEWSFSAGGDRRLGVRLAAACAPLYVQLSLLPECITSTERALTALDSTNRGTRLELQLQLCFGLSLLYAKGNVSAAQEALERAMQLAKTLNHPPTQLLLLWLLFRWELRSGDFRRLSELTARFDVAAGQIQDPLADAVSHVVAAVSHSLSGDQREVSLHASMASARPVHLSKLNAASFDYTHVVGGSLVHARSLWILGYPDQAVVVAEQSEKRAVDLGRPPTIAYVLAALPFVYLRTGHWAIAEEQIQRLSSYCTKHRLGTYTPIAAGWRGSLAILQDDALLGTELLQSALAALETDGYGLYRRQLSGALAEGYALAGQLELAYTTICEAIEWSEGHGPAPDLLELLRIKGEILTSLSPAEPSEGEKCLLHSLQLARRQSLLSLELRAAMSLARLWAARGRVSDSAELLEPIYRRFTEGFQTRDLVLAGKLLSELRDRL
jgi:predicted ATPase/DNA-binding winged helix-turn-helix (wHTH) protein